MTDEEKESLIIKWTGYATQQSWRYAHQYCDTYANIKQLQEELEREGITGICVAADRFDASLGKAFSTYATYWIRKYIFMYLNKFYKNMHESLDEKSGIADDGSSSYDDECCFDADKRDDIDEGVDSIPSGSSSPADSLTRDEIGDMLAKVLSVLNERERYIINKHFGMDGGKPMTFKEIGDEMGVTAQRIFSIEKRCIAKMRSAYPADEAMELLASLS